MADDVWTHANSKEWTITFAMAREYGWQPPAKTTSHPNYILDCPSKDPQCRIRAYGTSNADAPARRARRTIRQCTHVPETLFSRARKHVAEGERIIGIVELQVSLRVSEAEVHELVSQLETKIDEADADLESFVTADDKRKSHEESLLSLSAEGEKTLSERENQSRAKNELTKARKLLVKRESAHSRWKDLDSRVKHARTRLDALNAQVDQLR